MLPWSFNSTSKINSILKKKTSSLLKPRLNASRGSVAGRLAKKHSVPKRLVSSPVFATFDQMSSSSRSIINLHKTSFREYSKKEMSDFSGGQMLTPEDFYQMGLRNYLDGNYEDAMGNLTIATTKSPRNDKYQFALASVYSLTSKDPSSQELALKHFKKAFRLNPTSVDAIYNIGLTQQELGQYSAAANSFIKTLELNPKHADAHNSLGWIYYRTSTSTDGQSALISREAPITPKMLSKIESGIECFRKALNFDSTHAKAHNNLGSALLDKSKTKQEIEEAMPYLKKAVEMIPDSCEAHYNLATGFKRCGELHAAIAHFRTALSIGPETGEMWNNLALTLMESGELAGAEEAWEHAIRLLPSRSEFHSNLALNYHKRNNIAKAIECYERALGLASNSDDLHVQVAVLYKEQGNFQASLAKLKRALEINPQNPEIYKHLGVISANNAKWAEASAYFTKTLELNPKDPEAMTYLGASSKEEGKLDEAESLFKKAMKLDPDASEPIENLAALYGELQKWDQSLVLFEKVVKMKPKHAESRMHYAFLLQQQRRMWDALAQYAIAVELKPDDWMIHYNYALALSESGEEEKCKLHMETAQKLNPKMFDAIASMSDKFDQHNQQQQ